MANLPSQRSPPRPAWKSRVSVPSSRPSKSGMPFFTRRAADSRTTPSSRFRAGPSPTRGPRSFSRRTFSPPTVRGYCRRGTAATVLSPEEAEELKTALLLEVGRMDARRGWTMQLHLGVDAEPELEDARRARPRHRLRFGQRPGARRAARGFPRRLGARGLLAQDHPVLAEPGRLRGHGERHGLLPGRLRRPARCSSALPGGSTIISTAWSSSSARSANIGLLSRFVGMLTDSRSFLSFPRHEYFRRILCRMVGGWIERGEAPADFDVVGRHDQGRLLPQRAALLRHRRPRE